MMLYYIAHVTIITALVTAPVVLPIVLLFLLFSSKYLCFHVACQVSSYASSLLALNIHYHQNEGTSNRARLRDDVWKNEKPNFVSSLLLLFLKYRLVIFRILMYFDRLKMLSIFNMTGETSWGSWCLFPPISRL